MAFNIYLALLPVIFSLYLFEMPYKLISWIAGIIWFLYLPNTIYVFTDLHHLIEQWSYVDNVGKIILLVQYTILEIVGLSCYLLAFYPVEIILGRIKFLKKYSLQMVILLNIFIGLIMSLGKFERVNSWDIFVNPQFLLSSTLNFLQSYEMLAFGIFFGLFANFFYFLFRDKMKALYESQLLPK